MKHNTRHALPQQHPCGHAEQDEAAVTRDQEVTVALIAARRGATLLTEIGTRERRMLSGDDAWSRRFEDQKFFTRHKELCINSIVKQLQAVCKLPVRVRAVSKRNLRPQKQSAP